MRILVFQHLDVEHPGAFRDLWSAGGHEWDAVELDAGERIPDLDRYGLMVVMGGPMDVWQEEAHPWLVAEKAAIRRWVRDLGRPYLGVCLGHQLLADALGGRVGLMARPEVGLADVTLTAEGVADPLFVGLGPVVETFQWHGAEVSGLPDGAVTLAGNAACAVQAMRWDRHAYGLQFHCELTRDTVAEWKAIPAYARSLDEALGPGGSATLGPAVAARLPMFEATARRLDANLFAMMAGRDEDARSAVAR